MTRSVLSDIWTLRLPPRLFIMAARESDAALWLHNKLGSTDDLWSGKSICSQLTQDRLLAIQDCFINLQPHVKVKLLLSFLHLPKRSLEEVGVVCFCFVCFCHYCIMRLFTVKLIIVAFVSCYIVHFHRSLPSFLMVKFQ